MIHYQLEPSEIYETLLCIEQKREGRFKRAHITGLTIISAAALVLALLEISSQYFILIATVSTTLLFYILYIPHIRRQKKARKFAGSYAVAIEEDGICSGDSGMKQFFQGAKTEAFLSEQVFSVRVGSQIYCIPYRVLRQGQKTQIADILDRVCQLTPVKTERSY